MERCDAAQVKPPVATVVAFGPPGKMDKLRSHLTGTLGCLLKRDFLVILNWPSEYSQS